MGFMPTSPHPASDLKEKTNAISSSPTGTASAIQHNESFSTLNGTGGRTSTSPKFAGEGIDERGRRVYVCASPPPKEPRWARFLGHRKATGHLPFKGTAMMWCIQAIGGLAILFYGYDQGVMSGVNNAATYKVLMGMDSDVVNNVVVGGQSARDSATTGGIVGIYYLGTMIGGLVGGSLGDSIGRVKVVELACIIAIIGASLQASCQNITWMMFARVITGLGTGGLNAIIPVWESELALSSHRGAFLAASFFLNITGLATAYWLEWGLKWKSNRSELFSWRFPLAFQLVFLLIILFSIGFFPESPRWLAKMGRVEEARKVLAICRTSDANEDDEGVNQELYDIMEVAEVERQNSHLNNYRAMMFGSDSFHLRRRVWLIIWLQIMQELVGIGVVTVYAPTIFQQAGYSAYKAEWLSGVNDIFYTLSVLIAVFTLDRLGRRKILYIGAIVMGIALIFAGVGARYVLATEGNVRSAWGAVVATFTFVYTSTFGATWLTVPWLYPTEISPSFIRARGGGVSVLGWSWGNGIITVITPFLFNSITYWTFILFALLNFFTLPNIYFLYPETAGRTLEEMDVLFTSDSILVHRQEKDLAMIEKADPELGAAVKAGDRHAIHRKQSYRPKAAEAETRFTEDVAAGAAFTMKGGQRFD